MKPGCKLQECDHRSNIDFFSDENIGRTNDFLQKIKPIADRKNVTLGQLVLRWTIDQPGITIALVGARNSEQAIMNAKAADIKFIDEEIREIDDQLLSLMHAEL